jgi:hypothetical protein
MGVNRVTNIVALKFGRTSETVPAEFADKWLESSVILLVRTNTNKDE